MMPIVIPQTYAHYYLRQWIWAPNLFFGGLPYNPTCYASNIAQTTQPFESQWSQAQHPLSLLMLPLNFSTIVMLSSPLCIYPFSFPFLPLPLSPSLLAFLYIAISHSPPKKPTLSLSTLIPLYRLPLVGLKSLLFTSFHVFSLSSCLLRIL